MDLEPWLRNAPELNLPQNSALGFLSDKIDLLKGPKTMKKDQEDIIGGTKVFNNGPSVIFPSKGELEEY